MTAWANNLNGVASGTTVTTGNSGGVSGTAFNTATVPSGGSLTAQSAAAFEGATGLQIVWPSTSSFGYVGWNATASVGVRLASSFWFQFGSLPSLTSVLYGTSVSATLQVNASGQILVTSSTGSTLATSTAVAAGTWLYIQHAVTTNASTSGGRIECNIQKSDASSLLSYDSGATVNGGTAAISTISFGRPGFTSTANTFSYDLLAADNTLVSGFPGTPPAPALTASPALTGTGTLTASTSGAPTATPNFSATGTLTTSAAVVTSTGKIKVWNGSAWVAKPLKVWNGSAWVTKPVKHWTGSAWVPTSY